MDDFEYVSEVFSLINHGIDNDMLNNLKDLIGKNQNAPPLGVADGSFTKEQWKSCRDMLDYIMKFKREFNKLKV